MTHFNVPVVLTLTIPVTCDTAEAAAVIARKVVEESLKSPTFGYHLSRAVRDGETSTSAYRHDLLPAA